MWYKCSNGDINKPVQIDRNSSKVYVYVRKDFVEIPASGEAGFETPAHWEWMEMKVPKEVFTIYEQTTENTNNVDILTECILEMSEIIYAE